ncbi:S1C family serine protease [Nocardioides cheoyonin]|uniref:S1C family serine protease n=1 Tax=Nocardioides cheoyonin TaxID=3156615 RepID=UPI0032B508BA
MAPGPEPVSESEGRAPGIRGRRGVVLGAALLVVALVAAVVVLAVLAFHPDDGGTPQSGTSPSASPSASKTPTVSDIYRHLVPSVVVVRTKDGSLGSGVVAADDGTILTADHVIEDGSAVSVSFFDGTRSPATVVSRDQRADVASLKPARLPQPLVPATIGGEVQVGGQVVAIGHPLGLVDSVSSGVVSGVDRPARTDHGRFTGLIQFDASVNPGSSGGPLLDAQGAVIGIVVSIADPGRDDAFAGIGFAAPIGGLLGGGGGGPLL